MYVCMYVCMYVRYVCMNVYMYECVCLQVGVSFWVVVEGHWRVEIMR